VRKKRIRTRYCTLRNKKTDWTKMLINVIRRKMLKDSNQERGLSFVLRTGPRDKHVLEIDSARSLFKNELLISCLIYKSEYRSFASKNCPCK